MIIKYNLAQLIKGFIVYLYLLEHTEAKNFISDIQQDI